MRKRVMLPRFIYMNQDVDQPFYERPKSSLRRSAKRSMRSPKVPYEKNVAFSHGPYSPVHMEPSWSKTTAQSMVCPKNSSR